LIFGSFPLDQALGAVLAHSHRLADRVLKKGLVLDEPAIAAIREAGRSEVIAARLEPGDIPENPGADRLAQAFDAAFITRRRAVTGRANLHAETAGLLRVDATVVDRINLASEALTIGTLADFSAVAAGDMVATIKVIPFAVPGAVLDEVERIARAAPAITLHPFRPFVVGLVVCDLPGLKQSVVDGTIAATHARVAGLGGTLLPPLRCPHAQAPIAASLRQLRDSGA
jgi:molybdenum cofactor cytidylyltransferase